MRVIINGTAVELPHDATVADAVARVQPVQPFAVAVNMIFVPRNSHGTHLLRVGDQIEVIIPVTGG